MGIQDRLKNIRRRGGKRNVISGVLSASYLASRAGLLPARRGRGAIFTLHHVRPARQTFEANAHLEVTPEFLEAAIRQLRSDGYDFVGLDDIPARLRSSESKPFAAFTLDDGYHNNVEYALPVFERHDVPFTVFITRGFAERTHSLWWETLAELLPQVDHLEFDFGKGVEKLQLSSPPQVKAAFDRFASYVWQKDETEAISEIDALSRRHGFDSFDLTHRLVMGREELLKLVAHPLATLGAHTVSHRAVSRLSDQDARFELQDSARWLEQLTGRRPASFAFPYGMQSAVSARDVKIAEELGFSVAVTTQPGTLSQASLNNLTGLPRISLNGYFQRPRYVSALASGIPFALMRR